MSKHNPPTILSVINGALGNQQRMVRLQSLLITITCCIVPVLLAIPAAVIAMSGGNVVLTLGLGTVPAIAGVFTARKYLRRSTSTRSKP